MGKTLDVYENKSVWFLYGKLVTKRCAVVRNMRCMTSSSEIYSTVTGAEREFNIKRLSCGKLIEMHIYILLSYTFHVKHKSKWIMFTSAVFLWKAQRLWNVNYFKRYLVLHSIGALTCWIERVAELIIAIHRSWPTELCSFRLCIYEKLRDCEQLRDWNMEAPRVKLKHMFQARVSNRSKW
jgi:hypothetical protein